MVKSILFNPVACLARGIENLYIQRENNRFYILKRSCGALARTLSVTLFPLALTVELIFKKAPKALLAITFSNDQIKKIKFRKKISGVEKFALGILFSPLGFFHTPDAVSCFFLKTFDLKPAVRPFGVEKIYGKKIEGIHFPSDENELRTLILRAKNDNKQVSIIGSGMSQGEQTVPSKKKHILINMRNFKAIGLGNNNETVKAGAGAIWEEIQLAVNGKGKSVIVKQASDLFSVGGSIGINCHGWAHDYGAIASTVEELEVMDAEGKVHILKPTNPMFGCFFGTMGYFGIVMNATFKLADNDHLIEKTVEVKLDEFTENYENNIKNHQDIPLFGGRLVLDSRKGHPLRKVCMVSYEKDGELKSSLPVKSDFLLEARYGTLFQRVALQAISHLSNLSARIVLSKFWDRERGSMLAGRKLTRNEALHPPINAFLMLHHSNLHAQWLQEYFITKKNLPNFLRYLGLQLESNNVRLINATIRPTPKDDISILPYAEQDRYAVVLSFNQFKSNKEIKRTEKWIKEVNEYVTAGGDVYYQAYMPYASKEQFEKAYGEERVENMRKLKTQFDPENRFGNSHTARYFDNN